MRPRTVVDRSHDRLHDRVGCCRKTNFGLPVHARLPAILAVSADASSLAPEAEPDIEYGLTPCPPGRYRTGFPAVGVGGGADPLVAQRPVSPSETIGPPYKGPVAVIQPLPGIGDMVWHLPHIRAIAAHAGAPVTLITKPRSLANELLMQEPAVADIVWLDRNPNGRQGAHDGIGGFLSLVRTLRQRRFGTAIILHKSASLAAAAFIAGIHDRRGYGWGAQRLFLNNGPYLAPGIAKLRPHARATHYLRQAGIPMPSAEPTLSISPATRTAARHRLEIHRAAFVAIGIGSSEALRRWSDERFAVLAAALLDAGWPEIVLLGGPGDTTAAAAIRAALGERANRVKLAMGWHMQEVAGVLAEAAFYAGNDTGVMNMAAAAGIRAYAIYGRTPPIEHASQMVSITTPDIGFYDGVLRVTPEMVLNAIRTDRGSLSP